MSKEKVRKAMHLVGKALKYAILFGLVKWSFEFFGSIFQVVIILAVFYLILKIKMKRMSQAQ